ncbi:hypothetical protein H5410_017020 [Solanum commersonii]|uniref:Uncharacterized protein n=1 Tax=Solanum commersonii TaxID=4109 RepID=A0A9J5ZZ34_SOLCO|nr:hypothetical protein H5410_017020 [Solanum commersonii]
MLQLPFLEQGCLNGLSPMQIVDYNELSCHKEEWSRLGACRRGVMVYVKPTHKVNDLQHFSRAKCNFQEINGVDTS